MRKVAEPGPFLNERLMSDLRPDPVPGTAPESAGRQHFIVARRGRFVTYFPRRRVAGVDAVRIAQARIAAGQSELTLDGGAYNAHTVGCSSDLRRFGIALKAPSRRVWDRGPHGGLAPGNMGAFLVLESSDHARRAARGRERGLRGNRRPQPASTRRDRSDASPMGRDRRKGRPYDAAVISGATGLEPATSRGTQVLKDIGLPVRNTGTYIGHGVEASSSLIWVSGVGS